MTRKVAVATGLTAVVCAAGMVAGASLTGAVAAPAPEVAAKRLVFAACADELKMPAGFECATLRTPLDHAKPGGRKISVTVNRHRATGPKAKYQGVLLVNPGGPGGSGLGLAARLVSAKRLSPAVLAAYDVIGFDPRGVGASTPVHCLTKPEKYFTHPVADWVPADSRHEATLVKRAQSYAKACGRAAGDLLPYLSTEQTVRDMEAIRAGLGARQLNYLGYSYGTYLGAVYGTLFPQRVRRMVLDSSVDPQGVWYRANIAQDHAFQARLGDFHGWVATHHKVFRLGTTTAAVRANWDRYLGALKAKPAGGKVGKGEMTDYTLGSLYSTRGWEAIARAFSDYVVAKKEDTTAGLFFQEEAADENGYAVYLSVQCRDAAWPRLWTYWHLEQSRVHQRAPFMTWSNAWYNAPCAFWPVKGGPPVRVDGRKLAGVLMFQSTRDPATPYRGSLNMLRALGPNARMVVEPGGGRHGLYSSAYNACVDRHGDTYLLGGKLPARGTTCAMTPLPVPAGKAGAKTARPVTAPDIVMPPHRF